VSERPTLVLVVEDEPDIRELLRHQLRKEGYSVECVGDGPSAIEVARRARPAVVILDVMLPGMSGVEVCRKLRAEAGGAHCGILMLTARGEEIDRVVGFEVGADDYVTKPFSPRELMLRVRALSRRLPTAAADDVPTVRLGRLHIDADLHRAWVDDVEIALTATEFKLLHTLARRAGRVQSRGQLLRDVWDAPPDLDTRTVDTHIKRLREKLGPAGDRVETVRGVGYRLNPVGAPPGDAPSE
jgi:two-component system phosphate regulon response regulator PhoB